MGIENIQFPEEVGDGALAGFHDNEGERARDFAEAGAGLQTPVQVPQQMVGSPGMSVEDEQAQFAEAMMGERHQSGSQHDLQPRGFTSDDVVERAVQYEQQQFNELDQVPVFNEQVPQQNFQQMYGQSENEKGEWRRRAEAAELQSQQLQMQLQVASQPQIAPPNFYGEPASPVNQNVQIPQQGQNTAVPQQPQYDLRNVRFVNKDDNEMLVASDVDTAIREQVAPYVLDAYNRAAAAEQKADLASRQLFESHKLQMGITPQVEQAALAQQPWIRNIQDPQAYLGALQNFKTQADRAMQAQRQQPNPVPQAQQPQQQVFQQQPSAQQPQGQRMLRRTTYIEGQGVRMAGEAGSQPQQAQQQWEAQWAATMNLPFEQRANAQRKLLANRGVQSVTGYRDPMVLTS